MDAQCVSCDNVMHGSAAPAVDPEGSGGQTRALTLSTPRAVLPSLTCDCEFLELVLHSVGAATNTFPTASQSPPAPPRPDQRLRPHTHLRMGASFPFPLMTPTLGSTPTVRKPRIRAALYTR